VDVDTVTLFLALLAVVAQAAVAGLVGLRLAALRSSAAREREARLGAALSPSVLPLALAVALTATLGSLYLSEVAHYPPCRLCWYQRIAVYPLVPLLAVAWWRRDRGVRPYAVALVALGLPVSLYHVVIERLPSLEGGACDPTNPCSIIWVERLGYLTIPVMAATAQALVAALLLLVRTPHPTPEPADDPALLEVTRR
jgi:disulfide bond formation protein DsbB